MKLSSDASVLRLNHEGVTNSTSLSNFDKKIIENLPSICKNIIPSIEANPTNSIAPEASVSESNMSSMSVSSLVAAVNAAKS